uniref:Uncharacterized protein n=1 Tax=Nelumbo nucifera TaxID=4432 RepID=A0A822XP17_NELNU|nr:TPA_asm: hypothetical protein HUJ06_023245 [Nelumbo nucifera]
MKFIVTAGDFSLLLVAEFELLIRIAILTCYLCMQSPLVASEVLGMDMHHGFHIEVLVPAM